MVTCLSVCFFFFFNDTATTEIYTLSLHDALPICCADHLPEYRPQLCQPYRFQRSEEHTSELQSLRHLVCRLLLEKKKNIAYMMIVRLESVALPSSCLRNEHR